MSFYIARNERFQLLVLKVKMRLNSHPMLRIAASKLRFWLWKLQVHFRSRLGWAAFDIHHTCWVNPDDIQFVYEDPRTTVVARKYANRGKVMSGDWDRLTNRFVDTDVYKGIRDHFLYGTPWRETQLYHRVVSEMKEGKVCYGCNDQVAYDKKCETLNRIYEDIKQNGYRMQSSIATEENDPYKGEDEISVCIGRDGDLLFEDGRHRLAMAKILKIERIPIKITTVHKLWHNFRMEIVNYTREHGGRIYQQLSHPDLASLPATHTSDRLELLSANLPVQSGIVLDIGSHWGYWSHRFDEMGFKCHAVESSVRNAYFLKKLCRAGGKRFEIHNCSVFDYDVSFKIDIVLGLNIFHHFLKDVGSFGKLTGLLNRLDMDAMFFEPHIQGESTMRGAYRDFSNDEFVSFILENSCLNSSKHIGQAQDGRQLYLLTR